MKLAAFLSISVLIGTLCAQTPKIMHKRLGGTNVDFHAALKDPNSPIRQSNFGLPPTIFVNRAVIDSIIVVNDSSVLVVTSYKTVEEFMWRNDYQYDTIQDIYISSDSLLLLSLDYDPQGTWKPGRDLMVNHAIFSPKLTCLQIESTLKNQYFLLHAIQEIVFVGFDCSKPQHSNKKKKGESAWFIFPKSNTPNNFVLLALALSLTYFFLLRIKAANKLKPI